MGLFVYIAFTMEVWFHLPPPHEYVCLALGQQPEESPGSLEFIYLSHGEHQPSPGLLIQPLKREGR